MRSKSRVAELEGVIAGIEIAFGLPEGALSTQDKAAVWLATLGGKYVDERTVSANVDAVELTIQILRTIPVLDEESATPIERLRHAAHQLLVAYREKDELKFGSN